MTEAKYLACVRAGGCGPDTYGGGVSCNADEADRGRHPMDCVNARGAARYCAWIGGALPTDEEWSAEASAGGTRTYHWGDEDVSCARAVKASEGSGCGRGSSWPVCSKRAGDSGNVWECTRASEGTEHAHRRGSWLHDDPGHLVASGRVGSGPSLQDGDLGIR